MKKATMFFAAATLGVTLLAVNSPQAQPPASPGQDTAIAMGFLINDNERPVGWYSFPVTDATAPVEIRQTDAVSAGAMANGTYYAQTYTPGPSPLAWNTLDTATGELTRLADCTEDSPLYVDMTYDYSTDELLAIYHYGAMSTALCAVNPADGKPIRTYANVDRLWLATLACSYDGDIYALAADGWLYTFDRIAGSFIRIGDTGCSIEYMQSMEFDHASGTLYWAATNYYTGAFYSVNPQTGVATYISDMGKDGEMTGLYIPFKLVEDGAPAAVSGLTVANPQHDGNITLTMTLPDKTASGTALTAISTIVLEQDGTVLKSWPAASMSPGASISLDAEASAGLHRFKVYATNDAGNGLPRSIRAFVGEDIPAAPASVTVETTGAQAVITWDAVTTGANGGWIDTEAVTYEVRRQPGDHSVQTGLKATSCTDNVETTDVYTYSVTASNSKGSGSPAHSSPAVLGNGMEIPYSYDFEDADKMLLWTILDGNGDGASWERSKTMDNKRTMLMRGNYSRTVDDWLISPPLKLEAGKSYKIVYDAGCMNENYPATYDVTFGREATSEGQHTIREVTTDLLMLNKNYAYLPEITEDGIYHIGFHAHWQPALSSLYVGNVTVEENHAARLTGKVTDGTDPIAGAQITFGSSGDSAVYTSDENGDFEIIEIEPGTYPLSISKFGFETFSSEYTFAALEHKQPVFALTALPTARISGRVINGQGHGLENASVHIHGYSSYVAVTDRDGYFSAPDVYRKGDYTVDAHALNYETVTRSLPSFDGDTDMGVFTLNEKLIAPGKVTAKADRKTAAISWQAPEDAPVEFRYDDGTDNYVFNMEMSAINEYTMVGVIYDTPAVFNSVSWNVWNSPKPGTPVDIVIFDLDEQGQPTTTILYEDNGLESENYNWHERVLKYPVVAPRGALIALRGDARLCMDSGGDNPDYPVMYDKMVMTKDYRTEPFTSRYASDGSPLFRGNLTLRASGLPMGAPRQQAALSAADAPQVSYDIWRLGAGQEADPSSWVKLNSEPLSAPAFTDNTWESAPKGNFRFAVKAIYTGGFSSYATFSDEVPHLLHSDAVLTFLTNAPGEDASSASVLLTGNGTTDSYSGTADEEGIVRLSHVKEGTYTMTCAKKGFATLQEEIEISGDEDFAGTFTLTESTSVPQNLMIEETEDPASRLLKWNVLQGLFEDFEGHEDFAVNSPGDLGWSYIDVPGTETYFSPDYDFPHKGEPMAFAVMNPYKSRPSMVDRDFMDTHSGEKVLVTCVSVFKEPNNDFIISPRLEMKEDFVISFWTRGYWWRYEEVLRVGYSTAGTGEDDFIWVGDPITVDFDDWERITVSIPKEARYVTINCISDGNNYYVAIDDIFIGAPDQIPGTSTDAPMRAAGKAVSYDVYLDGQKLTTTSETQYLLENLAEGNHTAGVTAHYASGDTEMATIDFSIISSGIGEISGTALSVSATRGTITVSGAPAGTSVRIYRPDGTCAATLRSEGSPLSVPVAPGVYFVTVGETTYPLSVR